MGAAAAAASSRVVMTAAAAAAAATTAVASSADAQVYSSTLLDSVDHHISNSRVATLRHVDWVRWPEVPLQEF